MRTFGETIRLLREERNLSQEKLADKLGVKRSTVAMWEKNDRSPNEDTKELIADFFNVDMNFLYGKTNVRNSYRNIVEQQISINSIDDAMQFIIKSPVASAYGGYDLDKMSEDEIIDFETNCLKCLKSWLKDIKSNRNLKI